MSDESIKLVQSTAEDGRVKDLRYRQRQFRSLHSWIAGNTTEIEAAVRKDNIGVSENEIRYLITDTLGQLRRSYDSLDLKAELAAEYSVKYGQDNQARRVPHALTYVIPESHLLFFNVMSILYACITAGSCCVVEAPDNHGAHTDMLTRIFQESLDRSAFVLVHERPSVHVLARLIVLDQSGNLPTTGLSDHLRSDTSSSAVAVIDRTADLDKAAQEIAKSWQAFAGRSMYAPNRILVNEFVQAKFFSLLSKHLDVDLLSQRTRKIDFSVTKCISGDDEGTILKTPRLEIIETSDRKTFWKPLCPCPRGRLVISVATSSHDDAIDTVNATEQETMLALYVFADPGAAKYVAQFIRTRVSFVNHIPTSMLVRPAAPIGYPVDPNYPYNRAMFESASPQFVRVGGLDLKLEDLKRDDSNGWQKRYTSALQPLKPTGQPKEGHVNFFAQALVAGVIVYALPTLAVTIGGFIAVVRQFKL